MITAQQPKCTPDGRYNVTETCELLGIHRKTLHRYVERGAIRFSLRRIDNRKVFAGAEILRIWRASL